MHDSCILSFTPKVNEKKKPKGSSRRTDRTTYTYTMLLTDAYYELAAANGLADRQNRRCHCLVVNPQHMYIGVQEEKTHHRPLCD